MAVIHHNAQGIAVLHPLIDYADGAPERPAFLGDGLDGVGDNDAESPLRRRRFHKGFNYRRQIGLGLIIKASTVDFYRRCDRQLVQNARAEFVNLGVAPSRPTLVDDGIHHFIVWVDQAAGGIGKALLRGGGIDINKNFFDSRLVGWRSSLRPRRKPICLKGFENLLPLPGRVRAARAGEEKEQNRGQDNRNTKAHNSIFSIVTDNSNKLKIFKLLASLVNS